MKKITFCQKRDGTLVPFEKTKIVHAINEAFLSSNEGNKLIAQKITESIMERITRIYRDEVPTIEEIQDIVEDTLISYNFIKTAKSYILYRNKKSQKREVIF